MANLNDENHVKKKSSDFFASKVSDENMKEERNDTIGSNSDLATDEKKVELINSFLKNEQVKQTREFLNQLRLNLEHSDPENIASLEDKEGKRISNDGQKKIFFLPIYEDLIDKSIRGTLSQEEAIEFNKLLNTNPEFSTEFENARLVKLFFDNEQLLQTKNFLKDLSDQFRGRLISNSLEESKKPIHFELRYKKEAVSSFGGIHFDLPQKNSSIIKVIGVGGGGGNAVNHMFRQGIVGVDFAIANTDHQALEMSPIESKIQLGKNLTEGRGAGMNPEIGRRSTIESLDEVKAFLDHTKLLFITAGMGKGTGTGGAPVIAKLAKEMGILTVGLVTSPFSAEGPRRFQQAQEGIAELRNHVDSLIVISNDKLREIHGNLTLSAAFAQADNILSNAAKSIAEIITVPGYVNVDFEDVNTVMRNSGVAIIGLASSEGENRAIESVEKALNSPLLNDNDIHGAKNILLNISTGTVEATLDEISEITEYIQREAGYETNIIWGNCYNESLGEKLLVTVIASCFEASPRQRVDLSKRNRIEKISEKSIPFEFDLAVGEGVIETPSLKIELREEAHEQRVDNDNRDKVYEDDFVLKEKRAQEIIEPKNHQVNQVSNSINSPARDRLNKLRNLSMKLDNPTVVTEMEKDPAFMRRGSSIKQLKDSPESNLPSQFHESTEDSSKVP